MRSETGVRIIDHRCIDAGLEDAGQFQKVERGVSHLAFLTRGFVLVRKGTGIAARCASMVGQVLCGRFLRCKRRVSRRSDAVTKGNPRHLYLDCKVDTVDRAHPWDYYMVHNDLWQVAGIGANMLCLGC